MQAYQNSRQTEFPGLPRPKTYAAFPVWAESTRSPVRFAGLSRRDAGRLWHDARRFERQTRGRHVGANGKVSRQDGIIGRNGLAVLQALLFDCLNFRTGRLDPSYAAIARLANISYSSAWRGLKRLKAAGVLNWIRRCAESVVDGRWCLEQETNAYTICPSSQWSNYHGRPVAPPPDPSAWGAAPPLPGTREQVLATPRSDVRALLSVLEADADDPLAAICARLAPQSARS